jgi:hypothetical protein
MRSIRYLDFDLLIERGAEPGHYEARVISAPSGEYEPVDFAAPFSDLELENFLLKIGRRRNIVRGLDTQEGATVRQFGSQLFDRVFTGNLRLALATSLSETDSDDLGLRMRLRLSDCPELADIPWEYLYDKTARRFLALSEWTPVVRYLDLPGRVRRVSVKGPLRILGMASSPTDYPRLAVDDEWAKLRTALEGLVGAGRVELRVVGDGTLSALHRELRRGDFHVFHYIGHGGFLPGGGDGVLILEDAQHRGLEVSGQDLGVSLHDHRTLRLAILNSCEGARSGITDPYAGTAQTLVQQGIPAVVAMQFEISDDAAITFSQVLYEAIADGYPLDAAMAEARKAVRNQPNATEWGTPVLYLRSPDGHVFDMTQAAVAPPPQPSVNEHDRVVEDDEELPDDVLDTPAVDDQAVEADEERPAVLDAPALGDPVGVGRTDTPDDLSAPDSGEPDIDAGPETQLLPRQDVPTRDPADPVGQTPAQSQPQSQPGSGSGPPAAPVSTWTRSPSPPPAISHEQRHERPHDPVPPDPGGRTDERRRRWPGIVAAAAVLAAAAAGVGYLTTRDDGGGETGNGTATATEEDLIEAADPYFDSNMCDTADEINAPIISSLPATVAIKCENVPGDLAAAYWCTDTVENFDQIRARYFESAVDGTEPVLGTPADSDQRADGVQVSYHIDTGAARVYWDSTSLLCGAELQTTSDDVDSLINVWQTGSF